MLNFKIKYYDIHYGKYRGPFQVLAVSSGASDRNRELIVPQFIYLDDVSIRTVDCSSCTYEITSPLHEALE